MIVSHVIGGSRADIEIGEREYSRITVTRWTKPGVVVHQDGKGNLIIEYAGKRILDERVDVKSEEKQR
jgi:hypothetical protein